MIISPYGEWKTVGGQVLTIKPDATYNICMNGKCSSGVANDQDDQGYDIVLRGILEKEEMANVKDVIKGCILQRDSLTGQGYSRGLQESDLRFDTTNNLLGSNKIRSRNVTVSFDCTEDGRAVEFRKTNDDSPKELIERREEMQKLKSTTPLPRLPSLP